MQIERFLKLAVGISASVADLHRRGIVHKELRPETLILNPTGEVKVMEPGAPDRLSRRQAAQDGPRPIEGSLPYMAPEQTGRMNRTVDARADLYALGVTFYQMLTGRLPFEARDPLEWVHFHLARVPPSPSEIVPEIPDAIARIVMRLLAKMAEDRYQSARGLRHDLERCLEQWKRMHEIEPFPLGERDVPDRLQMSQKLYGREAEIALLCGAFDRVVATGTPELVLVSGYPGIGKSTLVHKLQRPVVRERGLFVSGKFDLIKSDVPYSTIVEAFRGLVLEILAESEERIAAWKRQIEAALGINGRLIVDVIPPVELIVGEQPEVPALPPTEARNRFHLVFRQFIGIFAQREHPLTLFFDDLQWADSASLALLQDLLTDPGMHHLFVVGAYRDSEVDRSHPLIHATDEVREAGARVSEIALGPLGKEQLVMFLSDTLRCSPEEAAPLSELVHEKTAGNPFFVIQFLSALHEERLIALDERRGAFRWDVARIRAQGFTDNVLELMVEKLRRLPEVTLEALTYMACLGNRADTATLVMIHGGSEEGAHAALREAVRGGLVLQQGDSYQLVHDRIQEAAYSLIPEKLRPELHLTIGRLLLAHTPADAVEERIFDIVSQLNRGVELITDARERESLARLNRLAGTRAKASIAYASARNYLAQATALLPPDAWSARYEDTLALYLERSECEYLAGSFGPADELFKLILESARADLDRAAVYSLRMRLYQVSGRYEDAVSVALSALRLFGVTLPGSDEALRGAEEAEIQAIRASLRGRRVADILDAPEAVDPEVRALIGLLVEAEPCAYIGRPKLFPLLALKAVSLSLRHGNTRESCFAYSVYGFMLVSVFGDIPLGFEFSEMSLRLNERFNNLRLRGTLLHLHGDHINFWRRPIATDIPILEEAFRACLTVGDLVYAGFLAFETVWQLVEKGDPLDEVLEASRRFAAFARQSHNLPVLETIRLEQQLIACLKGETRGPTCFDDAAFDEAGCLAVLTRSAFGCGVVFHDIMKQICAFLYGRYAEALESAARAAENLGAAMAMPIEATHHFFHALTLLALLPDAAAEERRGMERALKAALKKLRLWAESCPENYLNRYALVSAEVARVEGRDLDAMCGYEQAIRSARENGFVYNEGLAHELGSRFYRARGFEHFADTYLREARACYARWGADGKVRQLEALDPHLREPGPSALAAAFTLHADQLDLLSVVKASQTISGEIHIDELARTLLRVVLEEVGAQKGYLILVRDGALLIEAEASLGEGGVVTRLLPSVPVSSSLVPSAIVKYALRAKERVLLDDAAEGRFAREPYIARARPKSVLCLPILRQASVIGLLYLENNLLVGAFTPDRLSALSLLAAQAAISLENAQLLSKEHAARTAAEEAERRAAFLAREAERLYREAQEALHARDVFLSVASHELKTPLTSLMLTLQSMDRAVRTGQSSDTQAMSRLVERASRQGVRLCRLNEDLLDVSRIHVERLPLELAEVDLQALVREVVEQFKLQLAQARCLVSIQDGAPIVGLWDRSRVEQIVTNLLSNAIKFGAGKPIEISIDEEAGTARLAVKDHGIGVEPAQQGRIFERFARAVSNRHYGGLGLGLYISRSLAQAHGGSIRVQSEPGAGSTFIVELPTAGPPSSYLAGAGLGTGA